MQIKNERDRNFLNRKRALVCGVSGQDGAYLSHFLLQQGYEVFGTSRDVHKTSFDRLEKLGILNKVQLVSMMIDNVDTVRATIQKIQPGEVYNLTGQSSVSLSFEQPVETFNSLAGGTLHLLEAIRLIGQPIKFFNAGSSECFGDTGGLAADESTPFHPNSPYALAKAAAFWQVINYRTAYNVFACSAVMFNHESPLRSDRFVVKKIILAACRIAAGSKEKLKLGNLFVSRDWGWAPDFVQAMWLMLQHKDPQDFVLGTGESHTLEEFVSLTFSTLGMNWKDHVELDPVLMRTSDVPLARANSEKARIHLKWVASQKMPDVVRLMIESEKKSHLEINLASQK